MESQRSIKFVCLRHLLKTIYFPLLDHLIIYIFILNSVRSPSDVCHQGSDFKYSICWWVSNVLPKVETLTEWNVCGIGQNAAIWFNLDKVQKHPFQLHHYCCIYSSQLRRWNQPHFTPPFYFTGCGSFQTDVKALCDPLTRSAECITMWSWMGTKMEKLLVWMKHFQKKKKRQCFWVVSFPKHPNMCSEPQKKSILV